MPQSLISVVETLSSGGGGEGKRNIKYNSSEGRKGKEDVARKTNEIIKREKGLDIK